MFIETSAALKNKSKELDLDYIGGQGSLTKEEGQAISGFMKTKKLLRAKKQISKTKTTQRKKTLA